MEVSRGDEMFIEEIKAGNRMAFDAMVLKYKPKLRTTTITLSI